jgi:hypothetical protein
LTNQAFLDHLKCSTAHRLSREYVCNLVFNQPDLLNVIFEYGCEIKLNDYHKSWWVMELIFEEKPSWLLPIINEFCLVCSKITSDSALRSVTKICLFISKSNLFNLNESQKNQVYQCLFDCLIETKKAANAAYSMYALYEFGKKDVWIHEELQLILSKGFDNQTPAYRAATKKTLYKLNKKS